MQQVDYTLTGKLSEDMRSVEIDHAPNLRRILEPLKDKILEINIKIYYRLRSLAQNRWMWGVCIPTIRAWMKETTGESPPSKEAVYAYLRQHVLGNDIQIEIVHDKETIVISGRRFSQMTTVEFSDAVEKIVAEYAEKGLEIPLPKPKGNNLINEYMNETDE